MATVEDIGERLREAACVGDLDLVVKLLNQGADVNGANSMNGWTALHWACKRNHVSVASYLKQHGADNSIKNREGHIPAQLSSSDEILQLFGVPAGAELKTSKLPITPNYLSNPAFPYSSPDKVFNKTAIENGSTAYHGSIQELVLKARVANCEERDFIEIELTPSTMNYNSLLDVMCNELKVDKNSVAKIRKLPDTIVRKDKDVLRFKDFQEIELVLTSRAISAASRTYNLAPAKNNETILY